MSRIDSDSGNSSDSDSVDSTYEEGTEGTQDSPMMSIFASYYGIEEPIDEATVKPKGTIDDANFEPETFVRNLLLNDTVEGLVAKDSEMVHEIRTLDGEMQKLVYDNYNKFITATETIKEMKNDVYGMDQDMDSVRMKMAQISQSSLALDEVLHEKRTQVDKIVRVRRLLHRLEFLCELPERLAGMIDARQYKEAVQLYHQTISVLTRHQHVLSFKNIKERTEAMMVDLTGRVLNMLDDSTLEDVKLTQYVTVLRLMSAPRMKVLDKLLAAHKHRSLRMVAQFNAALSKASGRAQAEEAHQVGGGCAMSSASCLVLEMLNEISDARRFAQSLIVGLIEACKGVYDLFQPRPAATTIDTAELAAADEKERAALEKDARQAYAGLRAMISAIMVEYTKSLVEAFRAFFARYEAHFFSVYIDYNEYGEDMASLAERRPSNSSSADGHMRPSSSSAAESSAGGSQHEEASVVSGAAAGESGGAETQTAPNDAAQVSQFKSSELQEERGHWMLLARQAINDVTYLDSTQWECRNNCNFPTDAAQSAETGPDANATAFADALLAEITSHCEKLQAHRINCYLQTIVAEMPRVQALCVAVKPHPSSVGASQAKSVPEPISRPRLGGRATSTSSSLGTAHSFSGDSAADRRALQRQTALVKKTVDRLVHFAGTSFAEAARDAKCVADICEGSQREGSVDAVVLALVSKHCNRLAHSIEQLCGVRNYACAYDYASNTVTWASRDGVRIAVDRSGADHGQEEEEEASPDCGREIYSETVTTTVGAALEAKLSEDPGNTFPSEPVPGGSFSKKSLVKQAYPLLFGAVLRGLLPVLMVEVNAALRGQELPTIEDEDTRRFQVDCCDRLDLTCQLLLAQFVEANASQCAHMLTGALHEVFSSTYQQTGATSEELSNVSVSDAVVEVAQFLDAAAVLGYALLNDQPPPLKMPGMDMMRRGAGGARASVVGGGHHSLQLDIERLFSQRIRVFDNVSSIANADFLLGTVLKAALKASLEVVRCMTVGETAYMSLQANVTFVKQVAACLVRDCADCDSLVDQTLSAVFSRYLGADDIANASDGNEVAVVGRAVGEAFARLGDNTVLVTRSV